MRSVPCNQQIIETESAAKLTIEDQQILSQDQKHTSFVAQVHYQKLQSRDVASKGKQVMEKLTDETPSRNALSRITETLNVSTLQAPDFNVTQSDSVSQRTQIKAKGQRQKKVAFSSAEDNFLKLGIQKYGCAWSKILADPEFTFHSSRQGATLCRRAQTCKLT